MTVDLEGKGYEPQSSLGRVVLSIVGSPTRFHGLQVKLPEAIASVLSRVSGDITSLGPGGAVTVTSSRLPS